MEEELINIEELKKTLSKFVIRGKNKSTQFEILHIDTKNDEIILKQIKFRCR